MKRFHNILFFVFSAMIWSCNSPEDHEHTKDEVTYTCPMHPQIVQAKPGTCPVCGMDLVVFDRSNKDDSITLNEQQRLLANISSIVIGDTSATYSLKLNGRIVTDPSNSRAITSRVAGRIERLYVKQTGVTVTKGEPLFRIYSEDLAALQQEYLVAAAQKKQFPDDEQFAKIERAARQKLLLLGQSAKQISDLSLTNKTNPFFEYFAEENSVVSEVTMAEGGYVEEGDIIFRVESYNEVWVEADMYPGEEHLVKEGMIVQVQLPGERSPVSMEIAFVSPEFVSGTQITRIRGKVKNKNRDLIPGTQVAVTVPGRKNSGNVIPSDAVIRGEHGAHVWIEPHPGKFISRPVVTGKEDANTVEIKSGVETGDRVVVKGAYLLHSEYILKKGNMPESHNH
jgi:membrane fusion protein, copper/silver efflux system